MATDRKLERRIVRSDDPALSAEANRLLTEELRRIVGREEVEVPADTPRRAGERRAGHSLAAATMTGNRIVILLTFVTAVVVGAVISLATGSWWALVAALAVHALGTVLVAVGAIQLTTEVEHASPELAARLEREGVRNPDKLLSDLVEEFAGAREAHGTAEVIAMGHNVRRADPSADPARAAVEQRSAITPQSQPGPPAGERSSVALLPSGVVVSMAVASLIAALVLGGAVWFAPAVVVPMAAGALVLQHAMARGEEGRPGVQRRPGDDRRVILTRFVPVIALVVSAVVTFMVLVGVILGYD